MKLMMTIKYRVSNILLRSHSPRSPFNRVVDAIQLHGWRSRFKCLLLSINSPLRAHSTVRPTTPSLAQRTASNRFESIRIDSAAGHTQGESNSILSGNFVAKMCTLPL